MSDLLIIDLGQSEGGGLVERHSEEFLRITAFFIPETSRLVKSAKDSHADVELHFTIPDYRHGRDGALVKFGLICSVVDFELEAPIGRAVLMHVYTRPKGQPFTPTP